MRPLRLPAPLAALVLFLLPSLVAAQTCGQTVTGHLRLKSDLHCPGPGPALRVTGQAALVELDGHRIDMGGSGATGVEFSHALDSALRGPGQISGAGIAVQVWSSHDIEVSGLVVEGVDSGVFAEESARLEVVQNTFHKVRDAAIFVGSAPGSGGASHAPLLHLNTVIDVGSGIHLCGQGTFDARVRHNEILRSRGWGIVLYDGASQATVMNNVVEVVGWNPAIELRSASSNVVMDNTLRGSGLQAGVTIGSMPGQTCRVAPGATADRNVVTRNTLVDFMRGVRVGYGNGLAARGNNILGNQVQRTVLDLLLERDSDSTDARGNDRGGRGAGGVSISDYGHLSLH